MLYLPYIFGSIAVVARIMGDLVNYPKSSWYTSTFSVQGKLLLMIDIVSFELYGAAIKFSGRNSVTGTNYPKEHRYWAL